MAGEHGQHGIARVDSTFLDTIVRGGIEIDGAVCASKQDMIDSLSFMANECSKHLLNDIMYPRTPLKPQKVPNEIVKLKRSGDYVKVVIKYT